MMDNTGVIGLRRLSSGRRAPSMRGMVHLIACLFVLTFTLADGVCAERRPNVMVILADDMGYSDLGCFGSEIDTPNFNRLAAEGLRFTQFYNTARCWPTRGALMTGYYAQQIRRDRVPGVPSGGRGTRPDWAPLLPALLQPLGYRSYHSGKWHIDGWPLENGFDRSYDLRDQGRFFSPRTHYLDGKKLPAVQRGSGYYATVEIARRAVEFLADHQANYAAQPFFAYVAFTCPHFPLQALPEDIRKYRDQYRGGWDAIRAARFARMTKLGLVDYELSAVERQIGPPYDFPEAFKILGPGELNRPLPWSDLTTQQRDFQATKMAIHAAMIDRMDQELGTIIRQLKAMQAWENTLMFVLSDNGASAEIMVRNDGHDPAAPPGSAATHLCLGPGWSTVCNTPLRRHKTWVHEGGISTPLIAHWPAVIRDAGGLRRTPGHVVDLVPTIVEVAGGRLPKTWHGHAVPPRPGRSLVPLLARDGTVDRDFIWWLHEDNKAIRAGKWKLVSGKPEGGWHLYDMERDRSEQNDVFAKYPETAARLARLWQKQWEATVTLAGGKLRTESRSTGRKVNRRQ